jgi:NADH-quinone oxidoreductase subunit C
MKIKGYEYLEKITAVDYVDHLEVIYMISNLQDKKYEIIKVKLQPKDPKIDSVMRIYNAADWYERELSEMFGIKIHGRKARRLLLEKWNGSDPPLRKNFVWGNPNYKRLG